MDYSTLSKRLQPLSLKKSLSKKSQQRLLNNRASSQAGFSLLELIVVVLIIGILSAIAAPGWLAFVNRQRVNKVNDVVYSALQEAQREAKRTKQDHSVSFRTSSNVPQVAVYRADLDPNTITPSPWKNLTAEVEVKPEQVWVGTNIAATANEADAALNSLGTPPKTITFNQFGNLPRNADLGSNGLMVVVAVPNNNGQAINATKKCTIVTTLLGAMRTGQGQYDATNNEQGCL